MVEVLTLMGPHIGNMLTLVRLCIVKAGEVCNTSEKALNLNCIVDTDVRAFEDTDRISSSGSADTGRTSYWGGADTGGTLHRGGV